MRYAHRICILFLKAQTCGSSKQLKTTHFHTIIIQVNINWVSEVACMCAWVADSVDSFFHVNATRQLSLVFPYFLFVYLLFIQLFRIVYYSVLCCATSCPFSESTASERVMNGKASLLSSKPTNISIESDDIFLSTFCCWRCRLKTREDGIVGRVSHFLETVIS